MKTGDILLALAVGFVLALLLSLPAHAARDAVGLLLARSCGGEAGLASIESGECAAILHVYLKRAALRGGTLAATVRAYSAAVKRRHGHPNAWIIDLDRTLERPARWPRGLRWSVARPLWGRALDFAEAFLRGEVPDPLPAALHFGGRMDRGRLSAASWAPIPRTGFRNIFYRRR